MAKEIRCSDVGMDCDFVTTADTTEELLGKVVAHARDVHGLTEITPELRQKVASVIRDTPAAT
jgi:predicted small metal-binding protein